MLHASTNRVDRWLRHCVGEHICAHVLGGKYILNTTGITELYHHLVGDDQRPGTTEAAEYIGNGFTCVRAYL